MPDSYAQLRYELALANRLLDNEGVMDAFGHISVRNPVNPERFFLSIGASPGVVKPSDIIEYDLDGKPTEPASGGLYSERVIHTEIYRARPDVQSVSHHHSPAILPFCIAGQKLVPVFQLGGVIGEEAPIWDSRDEFGDTKLLLTTPEEGASLARTLGPHWVALMARHGAVVAGRSLRENVFRAVNSCANAQAQLGAQLLGHVGALSAGESELVGVLRPGSIDRAWDYWLVRLRRAQGGNDFDFE